MMKGYKIINDQSELITLCYGVNFERQKTYQQYFSDNFELENPYSILSKLFQNHFLSLLTG